MDKIIKFTKEMRKEKLHMEKNIKEILKKYINEDKHNYTMKDVENIANDILNEIDYYAHKGAVPIVKIAKELGFKVYKRDLSNNLSGDISINGDTNNIYKNNKVIIVNEREQLNHQRFVIAHELAHYLFDFLNNADCEDNPSIKFCGTYVKDKHERMSERRANAFAAAILMPRKLFIEQYNIAKKSENNEFFIITYLSMFFKTSKPSIKRRISEVFM